MDCLQIRAPPSAIAVTEECAVVQENVVGGCGLDSGGSRQGPVSGCFEDYNAILDFIIGDSQGLTTVFWDDARCSLVHLVNGQYLPDFKAAIFCVE